MLAVALLMISCEEQQSAANEEIKLDKHGSIDVKFHQQQQESCIVIATEKTFYDNNGSVIASKVIYDTLPLLGLTKDTLNTGRQDENGDDIDTVIIHKKNYQFFISVKPQS